MKNKLGLLVVIFSFLLQNTTFASPPIDPTVRQIITKNFTKSLPSLKIDSIESTPIANLYQVNSGAVVMYATYDGHYAISGNILDLTDGKTNLTQAARERALKQALDQFGESNMIVYAPPPSVKPLYTITVFTDVTCAYCQKFHAQIDKLNNLGIKVRYVAFPKTKKGSPAYDTLISIWCSADRKTAFNNANLGKTVKSLTCYNHGIDRQFNLGAMAGVTGTPTIVVDGKIMPGYWDANELLAVLKQGV